MVMDFGALEASTSNIDSALQERLLLDEGESCSKMIDLELLR